MRAKAKRLGSALVVVLLAGTGSHGQEDDAVRSGDALIYFYRTRSITDSILNPTLYSGERRLARLEKDRFFALPVPPGTHYFSWTDEPDRDEEAWVTVARGQIVFFKVRYRAIEPIAEIDAIEQMRGLRPIEPENIYDPEVRAVPVVGGP